MAVKVNFISTRSEYVLRAAIMDIHTIFDYDGNKYEGFVYLNEANQSTVKVKRHNVDGSPPATWEAFFFVDSLDPDPNPDLLLKVDVVSIAIDPRRGRLGEPNVVVSCGAHDGRNAAERGSPVRRFDLGEAVLPGVVAR